MTVYSNILSNAQTRFLAGDIIAQRKDLGIQLATGKRSSPAQDPAKDSLSAQTDVKMNKLRVARESIEAGRAILGIAGAGVGSLQQLAMKMEEARTKAGSGEISNEQRALLDVSFQAFAAQFALTVSGTKYGDKKLIDGSLAGGNTIETNTQGVLAGTHAESTLEYKMTNDAGFINVNGVRFKLTGATGASTPTSKFMVDSEKIVLSLNSISASDLTAAGADAITVNDVLFKFTNANPSGAPTAKEYKVNMANALAAPDLASALAHAINNPDGQEATTIEALAGLKASSKDGMLSIMKAVDAPSSPTGDDASFKVKFGSTTAGALGNKLVTSVTQANDPMSIDPAKENEYTVRTINSGEEYFEVAGEVKDVAGTGRKAVADAISTLIQNANSDTAIKTQIVRDNLAALSATVSHVEPSATDVDDSVTTLKLSAKRSGVAGAFSVLEHKSGDPAATPTPIPSSTTSFSSIFSDGAKVGSLGVSNTRALGSVDTNSIIAGLGTDIATSGFIDVDKGLLVDGATVEIGGRTLTLKEVISDPTSQIQVKNLDPLKTLSNIATFLNNSQDPSLNNYNYEVNNDHEISTNQLKFSARVADSSVNDVQMKISKVGVSASAVLTLSGGDAGGINTAKVMDNAGFIGKIQGFKASQTGMNQVKLQLMVGGIQYEGKVLDTTLQKDAEVLMEANGSEGGKFALSLKSGKGLTVDSKDSAEAFAKKFDHALDQLKFYQFREIDSFKPQEDSLLDRTIAEFSASHFEDGVNVTRVEVEGSNISGQATVTFTLSDGRQYRNEPFGNSISESQKINFIKITDPKESTIDANEMIVMRFGKNIDLTDPHVTKRFEADLTRAFQADKSPLVFQAGTENSDQIAISIGGLDFSKEFANKDFNIKSDESAKALADKMGDILAQIIKVNAQIGSGMSAFDQVHSSLTAQIVGLDPIADIFGKVDMLKTLEEYTENSNRMTIAMNVLAKTRDDNVMITNKLFQFQ